MTIKTIALGLFSAQEAAWLIPLACDLARGLGAHLTGAHPVETILPYTGLDGPYGAMVEPVLLEWQVVEGQEIGSKFESATRGESFGAEFRTQAAGQIEPRGWLLESLRAADLIVLARGDPKAQSGFAQRMREAAIRDSGRPVLILPGDAGLSAPAGRLLIGWSPTREATRAAHDALRLAAPGATIDLLRVHNRATPRTLDLDSRHDFAAALDRHGFVVNLVDRDAPAGETGATLLQVALETGAELVATGAYGHSRTYDFVIGAVTGHLLSHAEVPVLLAK